MFSPRIISGQAVNRLPIPVNQRETTALELDGFPEYIAEVTPQQRQKIDDLAAAIVKSHGTNDPIFEFRVEGHADVARRIANPHERKWFEDNISQERANNALQLLVQALTKHGGADLAQRIGKSSRAFGLGTTRLRVPNAKTEAEFRKNRRVAFVLRQVTFLPPPPEPPPPPLSVVEDRFSVRLLSATIATFGLEVGPESATVKGQLEITDKADKKRAVFNFHATGFGVSFFSLSPFSQLTAGPAVKFSTFRLLGRHPTPLDLHSFEGSLTVFIDASAGPLGGNLSFVFDALHNNGINSNPTVIRVPSGDPDFPQMGGAGFGDVIPFGLLTMSGGPSDLNVSQPTLIAPGGPNGL